MSKRGENIYKRKDSRWEGRYIKERNNNKIRYGYVYGKSYKETKEKLSEAFNNFKAKDLSKKDSSKKNKIILKL